MFNLSVDGHYDQTLVKDNSEQEIVYRTEGGDPSRALIGQLNYDSKNPSVIDISSWQQSCDDNNMTLVDAEPGSLIPIYDLVSDMGKKEQLKLAVENYLKEHSYVDIDDSSKGGAVRNNSRGIIPVRMVIQLELLGLMEIEVLIGDHNLLKLCFYTGLFYFLR